MWKALVLALLAVSAEAANNVTKYTCPSQMVQVKYQGQPYQFPAAGVDDHFASGQSCRWEIIIPDGMYADWGFTAYLQGIEGIADALATFIIYGDIEMGTSWEGGRWDKKFSTLSDKIRIELMTSPILADGQFRFNVTWQKMVPPMTPVVKSIADFDFQIMNLEDLNTNNVITFQAASADQQVALAADCGAETRLTDVWVYDGPAVVDGGAHENLDDTRFDDDLTSTQHADTLYNAIANAPLQKCAVMATDARNANQFDKWTIYYDPVNKDKPAELDTMGYKKPCAVTLYSPNGDPVELYRIVFHPNKDSAVKAYEGMPTPDTIGKPEVEFTIINHQDKLPYKFKTNVVTLVMSTGGATFEAQPWHNITLPTLPTFEPPTFPPLPTRGSRVNMKN